jgi:tetratricopeptide (TPR) repeat protein
LVLAGVISARGNRLSEAETLLGRALAIDRDRVDALTWLAVVKRAQNDLPAAIRFLERSIHTRGDDPESINLLGICHLALGHAEAAVEWFSRAVTLAPNAAQSHFNLGMALRLQNRIHESAESFIRAVELAPEHAQNYLQAFKQLQQLSRWDDALRFLEEGLKRHPGSTILLEALATAYGRLGRIEEADITFKRAAKADPEVSIGYATWLQEQGRFEESVKALRNSLDLRPRQGAAYRGLAEAREFELDGQRLLDRALKLYEDRQIDEKSRMHLAYAIAKAYDQGGEFEQAMRYFDIANEAAYRAYPASATFDPVATRDDPIRMAEVYRTTLIEQMRAGGSTSQKPIFIVGMIRSGTTLLDQIVSSHRDVVSAGELPFWTVEADRSHRKWRATPDPQDVSQISGEYLAVLNTVSSQAPRNTDKMPLNYRHLGLIASSFPNAKILHIRRNPVDTALSIYMTFFAGGPNFTYKKENIVAYYRAYSKFMEHWRATLATSQFYEVRYEDLVAMPEDQIRAIIEFCELSWDPACLSHQNKPGQVSTPSRWQARQPIYSTSVARWKRYEPWLGALLDLTELEA